MKNIVIFILSMLLVVHHIEAMQDVQNFITSIHHGSQPISAQAYSSDAGQVTPYSDGSIRIDNYLAKGGTFHLSADQKNHIELNEQGTPVRNSQNRILVGETRMSRVMRHEDGTIERYTGSWADQAGDVTIERLTITYPGGISISFGAENRPEIEPLLVRMVLALRFAITQADTEQVREILQTIPVDKLNEAVNFKLHDNTSLLFAIKRLVNTRGDLVQQKDALRHIIQLLLGAGADPSISDAQGNLPLTLGLTDPQLVAMFRKAAGEPLFVAIEQGNRADADKLITQERRPIDALRDNKFPGHTPLSFALTLIQKETQETRLNNLLHIIQSLVNKGADLESKQVQAVLKQSPKVASMIMRYIQPLKRQS